MSIAPLHKIQFVTFAIQFCKRCHAAKLLAVQWRLTLAILVNSVSNSITICMCQFWMTFARSLTAMILGSHLLIQLYHPEHFCYEDDAFRTIFCCRQRHSRIVKVIKLINSYRAHNTRKIEKRYWKWTFRIVKIAFAEMGKLRM